MTIGVTQATGISAVSASQSIFSSSLLGAVNRTIQSKLSDIINVLDFGIVMDGVTDNGTLLNTIIQNISSGILIFPPGTCLTGTFTLKSGVSLLGQGSGATTLKSNGTCTNGLITLPTNSVVQKMFIRGMTINGHDATSPQAAIQLVVGTSSNTTGWWYNEIDDVVCGSFLYGIWLDGGNSSINNPIQFNKFNNVVARAGTTSGNGLRCFGRVEHLDIVGGLFEYPNSSGKSTGDRILLQQYGADFTGSISGNILTVTNIIRGIIQVGQLLTASSVTSGTSISALGTGSGGVGTYTLSASFGTITSEAMTSYDTAAPTNISLLNATIQNGLNGIHAIGATQVDAVCCDFENLDTCVLAENGAVNVNVTTSSIRNAANNAGNTGAILAGNNGGGTAKGNLLVGTFNYTVYNYANNNAAIIDGGGNSSGTFTVLDGKTNGMSVQVNPSATISVGKCRTIILNTGATAVLNINSSAIPGDLVVVRAFGTAGTTCRFSTGGNLSIPGRTDLYIVAGQAVVFVRVDLSGAVGNAGYVAVSYPEYRIEMNSSQNIAIPTTGQTVTVPVYQNTQIIDPATTLAALTVQFPVPLGDGHPFELIITQAITTLTLTPNTGATISGSSSSTSGYTTMKFRYSASTTKWYKVGS